MAQGTPASHAGTESQRLSGRKCVPALARLSGVSPSPLSLSSLGQVLGLTGPTSLRVLDQLTCFPYPR